MQEVVFQNRFRSGQIALIELRSVGSLNRKGVESNSSFPEQGVKPPKVIENVLTGY
jgi:hypothetical protein